MTFAFDSSDTFDTAGTPSNLGAFQEALTVGDSVAVGAYFTAVEETSVFDLTDDTTPPTTP